LAYAAHSASDKNFPKFADEFADFATLVLGSENGTRSRWVAPDRGWKKPVWLQITVFAFLGAGFFALETVRRAGDARKSFRRLGLRITYL
jgi:hypothetical protein